MASIVRMGKEKEKTFVNRDNIASFWLSSNYTCGGYDSSEPYALFISFIGRNEPERFCYTSEQERDYVVQLLLGK